MAFSLIVRHILPWLFFWSDWCQYQVGFPHLPTCNLLYVSTAQSEQINGEWLIFQNKIVRGGQVDVNLVWLPLGSNNVLQAYCKARSLPFDIEKLSCHESHLKKNATCIIKVYIYIDVKYLIKVNFTSQIFTSQVIVFWESLASIRSRLWQYTWMAKVT